MYVLHDLWNGELYPAEDNCPTDEDYRTARKCLLEQEELFWKEISPAGKQAYEDFQDARSDLIWRAEQDAFVQGFCFFGGVQLMPDVLVAEKQQKRP